MARLRVAAGVLGIISLVIPWTFFYMSYYNYLYVFLDWVPFNVDFIEENGHFAHFSYYLFTSFSTVDLTLSVLGLILILSGSIILLASQSHPKVGGTLLLIGAIVVILDYLYDESKYGRFEFIPVGMLLGTLGGILGIIARPIETEPSKVGEDNLEKLQKLKILMDEGIITKEDFEAQKNTLLHGMPTNESVETKLKNLKSLLDSGTINQSEYDQQKKELLKKL